MKTSNKQTKKLFLKAKQDLEARGVKEPAASVAAMAGVAKTYEMCGLHVVGQLSSKDLKAWLSGYRVRKDDLVDEFLNLMAEVVQ